MDGLNNNGFSNNHVNFQVNQNRRGTKRKAPIGWILPERAVQKLKFERHHNPAANGGNQVDQTIDALIYLFAMVLGSALNSPASNPNEDEQKQ